jgi:phage terminase small subunit
MGARGPKPLPSNVHRLHGNASKKPIGELVDGVQPLVEIPSCPKYLLPVARAHWKFITPLLAELGLIAKIDRASLELYCQEYAWYVQHDIDYQADRKRVAAERAAWEADPANAGKPWTGGNGNMIPSVNGSMVYNPNWVFRRQAAHNVDKFLASFGMNPSARSRVTASDNYPYLPGLEPEQGTPTAVQPAKISTLADFMPKPA